MKKWLKIAMTSSAMLLGSSALTACGHKAEAQGPTEVSMYFKGDAPKNIKAISKKVNDEIQKQYPKIRLNMKFINFGDYGEKYNVMVTSGADYDLAFAQSYTTNAQKGAYADMTELLKTTGKKAYENIDPNYWKGLKVNGKIYGFPVNANIFAQTMATFNQEFLDKYDIDISNVHDYASLEEPLAKFYKANKSAVPMAISKAYTPSLDGYDYLTGGLPFVVDATGKDTKVRNVYDTDLMRENLAILHKYYQKGYISKDAATSDTSYNLQDNTWFMRQETQGPFDYGDTALVNAAGGKKMVSKPITTPYKNTSQTQVAVWSISKTSKHKKEAMQVLNAINTNPKILNNIVWGVEGTQWHFTDEKAGKIKTTDKYKPNYFIGGWMTGNNKLLYTQENITDEMIAERDQSIKEAKPTINLGFNADVRKFKTEITNISNVMSKYSTILNTGSVEPLPTIKKMNKELKGAGIEKVRKELQRQYDKFLKEKE